VGRKPQRGEASQRAICYALLNASWYLMTPL